MQGTKNKPAVSSFKTFDDLYNEAVEVGLLPRGKFSPKKFHKDSPFAQRALWFSLFSGFIENKYGSEYSSTLDIFTIDNFKQCVLNRRFTESEREQKQKQKLIEMKRKWGLVTKPNLQDIINLKGHIDEDLPILKSFEGFVNLFIPYELLNEHLRYFYPNNFIYLNIDTLIGQFKSSFFEIAREEDFFISKLIEERDFYVFQLPNNKENKFIQSYNNKILIKIKSVCDWVRSTFELHPDYDKRKHELNIESFFKKWYEIFPSRGRRSDRKLINYNDMFILGGKKIFNECLLDCEIIDDTNTFNKSISNLFLAGFIRYFLDQEIIFSFDLKWKPLCTAFTKKFNRQPPTKIEYVPNASGCKKGYDSAKNSYQNYLSRMGGNG
jgi:hypothetical protein